MYLFQDSHFLSAEECIMAAHFQNKYPNPCKYSKDGIFGSKFVTVIVTGKDHLTNCILASLCRTDRERKNSLDCDSTGCVQWSRLPYRCYRANDFREYFEIFLASPWAKVCRGAYRMAVSFYYYYFILKTFCVDTCWNHLLRVTLSRCYSFYSSGISCRQRSGHPSEIDGFLWVL